MTAISLLLCETNLGLQPSGVERLGATLVELGLAERLGADVAATLRAEAFEPLVDPDLHLANVETMASFAREQAEVLGRLLEDGSFPLVLGGDDSVLFGCLLALRRRGEFGLLFLDGHTDFYPPERSSLGEASDCDLLIASGRGPAALGDLDGLAPLVTDDAVAVYGHRDRDDHMAHGSLDVYETAMLVRNLDELRAAGMVEAGANAAASLTTAARDGIWIHLDADVLHDEDMPAVDWRVPDGLRPDELIALLAPVLATGKVSGMDVTIYNPAIDDGDRSAGRMLVDVLVSVLADKRAEG